MPTVGQQEGAQGGLEWRCLVLWKERDGARQKEERVALICFLFHNLKIGELPWYLALVNYQDAVGCHKNLTVSKKTNSVNSGIPQHSKVDYEWRSLPTHPALGYKEIIILYSISKRVFQGI